MKDFAARADSTPSHADTLPASCPACRSSRIVTTEKSPDAESYWRCTACGEVWNDARRQAPRSGVRQWH